MSQPDDDRRMAITIPDECRGQRLDQALTGLLPGHSRSQIQQWIRDGLVLMNGAAPRPRDKVEGGEQLAVTVPEPEDPGWVSQEISLDVVYEDETLLVINKPAGLVVHPGTGNAEGTLLNALLHHAPELRRLARAGIVHRLDKDTSGLLVVARTDAARLDLMAQLKERSVAREYLAIVHGVMVAGGSVDAAIDRHPSQRTRMAVRADGKQAVTHYRVEARYRAHTLLRVKLETGRTHQIRVHMAHIRYPLLGDPVYGGRLQLPAGASPALVELIRGFRRQALHAARLALTHPDSGDQVSWTAPPPPDMRELMELLAADARAAGAGRG